MNRLLLGVVLALGTLASTASCEASLLERSILEFVNAGGTTRQDLLTALGVPSPDALWNRTATRAADAILAYRRGPSAPIDTLRELYGITGVGTRCLARFEEYVKANSAVDMDSAILGLVDDGGLTTAFLRTNGITATTATKLLAYRDGGRDLRVGTADDTRVPYERIFGEWTTVTWPAYSVDEVPSVGAATIQRLTEIAMRGGYRRSVVQRGAFLLDEAALAGIVQRLQEGMWEDEGFAHDVMDLAGGSDDLTVRIMLALEAEIARGGRTLLGRRYVDEDAAYDAVADASNVKGNTRTRGWEYLRTLGVNP